MLFRNTVYQLKNLLALEHNCDPWDLDRPKNLVTTSVIAEGRRTYSKEPWFFHMVTMGSNVIITADERLHEFLWKFVDVKDGYRLFELPNLLRLEDEFRKYGYGLTKTHHMFLPRYEVQTKGHFETKWFEDKEIEQFFGDDRFPNAICAPDCGTPHRLVVCAYVGGQLAGMAGCREDAPDWYQMGVDVLPEYRKRGIGEFLAGAMSEEVIKRGKIPFFGTTLGNTRSQNIAISYGFRPIWVEVGAQRLEERE